MCLWQPFYSTDRITQLVKDVEQHLNTLLADEQGAPSPLLVQEYLRVRMCKASRQEQGDHCQKIKCEGYGGYADAERVTDSKETSPSGKDRSLGEMALVK